MCVLLLLQHRCNSEPAFVHMWAECACLFICLGDIFSLERVQTGCIVFSAFGRMTGVEERGQEGGIEMRMMEGNRDHRGRRVCRSCAELLFLCSLQTFRPSDSKHCCHGFWKHHRVVCVSSVVRREALIITIKRSGFVNLHVNVFWRFLQWCPLMERHGSCGRSQSRPLVSHKCCSLALGSLEVLEHARLSGRVLQVSTEEQRISQALSFVESQQRWSTAVLGTGRMRKANNCMFYFYFFFHLDIIVTLL